MVEVGVYQVCAAGADMFSRHSSDIVDRKTTLESVIVSCSVLSLDRCKPLRVLSCVGVILATYSHWW